VNIYSQNTPYTYLIKWSKTNIKYYGVRYGKNCHPNDLFTTYFTSSTHVKKYIVENGLPDIVQIRKIFIGENSAKRSVEWEHRVLKRTRAPYRTDYLNKTDNKSIICDPETEKLRKTKAALAMGMPLTKKKLREKSLSQWSDCSMRDKIIKRQKEAAFGENRVRARSLQFGMNSSNVDKTIYKFIHVDGNIEICTRLELKVKYNLNDGNLCSLIKGNRKIHKGWSLN